MIIAPAIKRILAFAAVICFAFGFTVFADNTNEGFYVIDKAQVLSADLEETISDKGEVLFLQTGCRFSVAAVDFLGGKTIEQYSKDLYTENSMGNNGVLLVISVAEENYHIVQGEALANKLSDADIKVILDLYAEESFEKQDYQGAVEAVHQKVMERLEEIYSVTSDREMYEKQLEEIELANQKTAKTKKMYFGVLAALAFIAFLFFVRMVISLFFYSKRK